jgi:GNAT superfamily N-acetyltransferase
MTIMPITFRRYGAEDADAIWAVFAAASAQLGFANGPWDDDMRTIPRTYLDSGGEFIVGELEGRIVAHAALLRESGGRALVRRVAVHPSVQRRGIGRMLMAALEVSARQLGITALHLDASQIAAHALYRGCGYREVGPVILGGVECIHYEKRLS